MNPTAEPNRRLLHGQAPQPTGQECIQAIGNADRRRILRVLHDAGEARSPKEVTGALAASLSGLSHHFRALQQCRVVTLTDTRPRRGSIEHFYISNVMDNELVGKLLEITRPEDEDDGAVGG